MMIQCKRSLLLFCIYTFDVDISIYGLMQERCNYTHCHNHFTVKKSYYILIDSSNGSLKLTNEFYVLIHTVCVIAMSKSTTWRKYEWYSRVFDNSLLVYTLTKITLLPYFITTYVLVVSDTVIVTKLNDMRGIMRLANHEVKKGSRIFIDLVWICF